MYRSMHAPRCQATMDPNQLARPTSLCPAANEPGHAPRLAGSPRYGVHPDPQVSNGAISALQHAYSLKPC